MDRAQDPGSSSGPSPGPGATRSSDPARPRGGRRARDHRLGDGLAGPGAGPRRPGAGDRPRPPRTRRLPGPARTLGTPAARRGRQRRRGGGRRPRPGRALAGGLRGRPRRGGTARSAGTGVVLLDGGVPLPLPRGPTPTRCSLPRSGPALARLRESYPSVEAYVDFFRAHPALGPHWSEQVADYVRYDALETRDGVRSRAVEAAVRQDGRDLLVSAERLDAALRSLPMPVHLLVAPAGMFGEPPGLLPAESVAPLRRGDAEPHRDRGARCQPLHDPVRRRRRRGRGGRRRPGALRPSALRPPRAAPGPPRGHHGATTGHHGGRLRGRPAACSVASRHHAGPARLGGEDRLGEHPAALSPRSGAPRPTTGGVKTISRERVPTRTSSALTSTRSPARTGARNWTSQ